MSTSVNNIEQAVHPDRLAMLGSSTIGETEASTSNMIHAIPEPKAIAEKSRETLQLGDDEEEGEIVDTARNAPHEGERSEVSRCELSLSA